MREEIMNTILKNALGGLIFAAVTAAPSFAQQNSFTLNSDRSIASVTIANSSDDNSGFELGVARVTGNAILDAKNPTNSSFNFTMFPSEGGSSPVNADGTWAKGEVPNVATYTILTFKSKQARLLDHGKLQLTGDLTVTHLDRPITLEYSEDYDGPKYGVAMVHSVTRPASFVVDLPKSTSADGQDPKEAIVTASSILSGEDFPGLLNAVLDTNWPVAIQNEESQMPATVGEDYSGASGSGTYVAKVDSLPAPQTIGEDYPGVAAFTAPAPNQVIIQARLVLNAGPAGQSLAAGN
jgi:polyisoprenoid-binding protein YceI